MARARMIARNITKSKKIAQLSDAQRVMYVFILPFLDREGRINAHPTYLKGNVFLHLDYGEAEIDEAVKRFHDVGLATVYATEDDVVMEYEGFLNYNRPDRKEVASEYPAPEGAARSPAARSALPPGKAQAMPGQSLGKAAGEVEVEVKVEEEVEVEVEVQKTPPKKNPTATPTPTQVQSKNLIRKKLGTRHTNLAPGETSDLLDECLAEDPSRERWFTILPARVQALIHKAGQQKQANVHGAFKTFFIQLLDQEVQADSVKPATTTPPVAGAPPGAVADQLLREAMGDELYAEMQRRSCGPPPKP